MLKKLFTRIKFFKDNKSDKVRLGNMLNQTGIGLLDNGSQPYVRILPGRCDGAGEMIMIFSGVSNDMVCCTGSIGRNIYVCSKGEVGAERGASVVSE